jgi:membrane-bound ClpP family serine protease
MSIALISFFILLGLLLILVEVLITPGIIVGSIGVLIMGFGVFKAYQDFGSIAGNWTLFGTFMATVIAIVLALRSNAWQRMSLKTTLDGKSNEVELDKIAVGDEGKTLSALRPSGNALINGIKVEVNSIGESIDSHMDIVVKEINENRIIVKLK